MKIIALAIIQFYLVFNFLSNNKKEEQLLEQINKVEFNNVDSLRFYAKKLYNSNYTKKSKPIGLYYLKIADYYSCECQHTINELLKIYPLFNKDLEEYKFKIDYSVINFYNHRKKFKKASERLKFTLNAENGYLNKTKFDLERSILIYGVTTNSFFLQNSSTLNELQIIKEKLQEKPWSIYHSRIYFNLANYHKFNNNNPENVKTLYNTYNKNLEYGFYSEAISNLRNLSFYDEKNTLKNTNIAFDLINKTGHTKDKKDLHVILGHFYLNKNDFENAEKHYLLAVEKDKNCKFDEIETEDYVYLGYSYHRKDPKNNYKKALETIKYGHNLANYENEIITKILSLQRQIWIHTHHKNFKEIKLLTNELEKVNTIRQNNKEELMDYEVNNFYSLREKDLKIQELSTINSMKENQIKFRNYFLLFGLIIFLLITYLFIYYNQRIRYLQKLELQNKKINIQNDKLTNQIETVASNNKKLENFAKLTAKELNKKVSEIEITSQDIIQNNPDLNDEVKKYFNLINEGSRSVNNIISGLLEFSTINKNLPRKKETSIESIFNESINHYKTQIKRNNVKIIKDKELPTIMGHSFLLSQLFSNLLSNAIKYSKKEFINFIKIDFKEYSDDYYLFEISDTGIGISPKNLTIIFNLFKKLHNKAEYPGHGIGLALTKKIIEEYGGEIWLKSELGKGTTVYFTLPK